jgi:hypothetical protein
MMPIWWRGPGPDPVPRPRTALRSPAIKRMRRSRTLGWDRNPLRRRTDRIEAAMVAALIGVFLICAPVLAAVASHWIGSATVPEQTIEAAWRLVPATGPPLRHSQVQAHTALAEWMAVLALALLVSLADGAGRVLLAHLRLADWTRAWRVAEPRWTRER